MDENRSEEQPIPAEQPQEAQRNLAASLAQDLNLLPQDLHQVALSVTSAVVTVKMMGKDNDQDPPAR